MYKIIVQGYTYNNGYGRLKYNEYSYLSESPLYIEKPYSECYLLRYSFSSINIIKDKIILELKDEHYKFLKKIIIERIN